MWTMNTKATTYDVRAKADSTVHSDGYRQKWIESITRDAAVAGDNLSLAARMDVSCRPLVAVWSTMNVVSSPRRHTELEHRPAPGMGRRLP